MTRRSGRSDSRTQPVPITAVSSSAAEKIATSASSTLCSVDCSPASGRPVTSTSPSWARTAVSRYSPYAEASIRS